MGQSQPRSALLAEAIRYLGTTESPVGSNRGLRIDYWLSECASPLGGAWCAAFVHQCGVQAVGRAAWPFRRSARVQDVVEAWTLEREMSRARSGDLIVFHYPTLGRWGHIAVCESVTADTVTTIDGNSNADGSREGYAVVRKTRPLSARVACLRWGDT